MKNQWTPILTNEFLTEHYINQKKNTYQIANEIGCNDETVRQKLIKFNISRRSKSETHTGLTRTQETCNKISKANKGKKRTPEQRLKMLEYLQLRKPGFRIRAGKKIKELWNTPEYRSKMLLIRKKQMTSEVIAKISKQLEKREITSLEKKIRDICIEYKLPFRYCGTGGFYIRGRSPDFVDTVGKKLIIEVFYEYFKIKQYGSVKKYCQQRRALFQKDGYRTLFLANNDLRKLTKSEVADKIYYFTWR